MVSAVNAADSLARLSEAIKKRDPFGRLDRPFKRGGTQLHNVIDGSTLEVMVTRVNSEVVSLRRALDSGLPLDLMQERVEQSESVICAEQSLIQRLNRGILPTVRLNNYWESHRCEDANA